MSTQAPPAAAALEVAGLSRSYGRLVGLHPFDLTLQAGECVALIGANGSGKSTAVRTIAGILEPSEGTVRIGGHDVPLRVYAGRGRAALSVCGRHVPAIRCLRFGIRRSRTQRDCGCHCGERLHVFLDSSLRQGTTQNL